MKVLLSKSLHSYDESIITDGVAVLLTILTMLSTPILTCIFGDGSLEVNWQSFIQNTRKSLLSVLNQGEDTEDWTYEEPAVMEVKSPVITSTN